MSLQKSFSTYLLSKGFSSSSIQSLGKPIPFFLHWLQQENIPLEQTSYNDMLHYIQLQKARVSQKTMGYLVNALKHYFNYQIALGQLTENPILGIQIKGIKRKVLYDILTKQELEALYKNYPIADSPNEANRFKIVLTTTVLTQKRNKVILGFLVYQGLTTHELGQLKIHNSNVREGTLTIEGGRKNEGRTLSLEAHQIMDLMEYQLTTRTALLQLTQKTTDQYFISTGTGHHLQNSLQKLLQKLQLQNPKVSSLQQIRASVITHWLRLYHLREVQYRAGHRFISSTEAYKINDMEELQEEINKYHPLG